MSSTALREQAEAWRRADPDPTTVEELARVLAATDEADLADRFAGNLELAPRACAACWARAPTG
jgi:phosphomannomutase